MRIAIMILTISFSVSAQTRSAPRTTTNHANVDQLGMTCLQILEMSSTDWVAKFSSEKGSGSPETIRAIATYGKCYDARTDQLAAKLGRTGKELLMGARGNFQSMEQALKTFTAKSLAETQPPADPVKSAYAALYEKQFRYEFYESYEPKPTAPATATVTPFSSQQASSSGATDQRPAAATDTSNSAQDTKNPSGENTKRGNDVDPLTAAKNHFGDLLGDLPDEQLHDLHQSFGEILGPNSATPKMQLLVYRYAIFLLEPSGGTPFSPPPF